jgi:hypothetical protein
MRTFLIRRTRPAAAALIMALTVTFLANCVAAAGATAEQQACCAAMDHDCGPMAEEHGCCTAETSKVQSGRVVKGLMLAPPSPLLVAILVDAEPRLLRSQWNPTVDETTGRSPGVPTYILVSTFRL